MNTQGKRLMWGAGLIAIIVVGYLLCRLGMDHANTPAPAPQDTVATTTTSIPPLSLLDTAVLILPDSSDTVQLTQGKGRFVAEGTPFFTEVRLLESKVVATHEGQQYFVAPFGVDSGGTGYFVYLGLFTASAPSAPQHLMSVFVGDRAIVSKTIQAEDGALEVTVLERPEGAPMAAEPTVPKVYRYMISNNTLVPLDAAPTSAETSAAEESETSEPVQP